MYPHPRLRRLIAITIVLALLWLLPGPALSHTVSAAPSILASSPALQVATQSQTNVLDVVISEIAWMGTTASSADEWIELYNNTASTVDITGWTLQAADGTPLITLSGNIPPHSYYLLERSDDTTLPAITADDTYTGDLENAGEDLRLLDAAATLIDQVDASAGWFAGHSDARVPMMRADTTVTGNQATNWTYSPRCGNPTNTAGVRYTCALTTTTTGTDLDYAVYFNERATTASSTTSEQTTVETALLQVISDSTATLDVALYGLDRQSVVNALIAAHQRGVMVHIVGDDDASQEAGYIASYQALRDAGITIVTDDSGDIQHNKFMVSDGHVVWTGSTNLTDNCLTLNANNSIVITSTTLAQVYTTEFAEMWGGAFHTAKTDNTAHLFDYHGTLVESYFSPTDLPAFEVWDELAQTTESVHFAMFYFTDAILADRMLERLADGVQVYGIWDQLGAANASSPDEQFCAAGAHIGIEDLPGLLHHKFAVLDVFGDDPRVVLGSYNWTDNGAYGNDENMLIIHHRGLAEAYYAEWVRLWLTLEPQRLCNPPALTQVQIIGPARGLPLTTYDFLAGVNATLDVPITYTWETTGQTPVSHVGQGLTDTVQFTWNVTGTQFITVTASNAFTTVVDTHSLVLVTYYYVYLPMVVRAIPAP